MEKGARLEDGREGLRVGVILVIGIEVLHGARLDQEALILRTADGKACMHDCVISFYLHRVVDADCLFVCFVYVFASLFMPIVF